MVYWDGVYDANIEYMQNVRIEAAKYLDQSLAPDQKCAASDIGAVRFFSQRHIVDLCGLIDPDLGPIFLAGDMDQYIVENEVGCLVLPGRIGAAEDGWFDHAEVFGFVDTPLFEMRQVTEFEIERERWLRGYLPTNNYQATMTVYQLVR